MCATSKTHNMLYVYYNIGDVTMDEVEVYDRKPEVPIQTRILKYIKSDYWVLIILMIALLGSMWTFASAQKFENDCNNNWISYYKECGCFEKPVNFTEKYSVLNLLKENKVVIEDED